MEFLKMSFRQLYAWTCGRLEPSVSATRASLRAMLMSSSITCSNDGWAALVERMPVISEGMPADRRVVEACVKMAFMVPWYQASSSAAPCSTCFEFWQQVAKVKATVVNAPRCRRLTSSLKVRLPMLSKASGVGIRKPSRDRLRNDRTMVRMRLLVTSQNHTGRVGDVSY